MSTTPPSFAAFFEAVHGFEPFPWQDALAERVVNAGWPAVIDAPTGMGKTSVVDIALYRLALDSLRPVDQRVAHTRIALVVDRRLIVDAVGRHVTTIVEALNAPADATSTWMRDALCRVGGTGQPLLAMRMRGGLTWASQWAQLPTQPMFVAATVDQLGSRLLFRGYGTSERRRPIDAGLVGTDTLVLLDEAHLSGAYAETAETCVELQSRAPSDPLPSRPLQVVRMTATPATVTEPVVSDADRNHVDAARRLSAVKNAALVEITDASSPKRSAEDAGKVLARLARHAVTATDARTVLVTANTVDAARHAFIELDKTGDIDAALVIGRCRPAERVEHLERWKAWAETGRQRSTVERPRVVVATQTVEVGVDLDVDALITEVAPIDSLVQRFGRVDRVGELQTTQSWIVRLPSRLAGSPPPYGAAPEATWQWLVERAGGQQSATLRSGGTEDGPVVDFGTLTMREATDVLRDDDGIDALLAPSLLPPVVTPVTARLWARTAPQPEPDESIVSYLHGLGGGQAGVTMAWRGDLDADRVDSDADHLSLTVPIQRHEQVEVSLPAVRRFLAGLSQLDATDLEAEPEAPSKDRLPQNATMTAYVKRDDTWLRLRRSDDARSNLPRLADLRPGDNLVVDAGHGGHDAWGFAASSTDTAADVADLGPGLAVLEMGSYAGPLTLRLDRHSLVGLVGRELTEDEDDLRNTCENGELEERTRLDAARDLIAVLAADGLSQCPLPRATSALFQLVLASDESSIKVVGGRVSSEVEYESREWFGRLLLTANPQPAEDASDEADASSETLPTDVEPVRLDSHLDAVGARSRQFAEQLGLADELCRAVELAGRLHDLGKADVRFQGMLTGGPRWMAEAAGSDLSEMFAKSAQRTDQERRQARDAAGWPVGYRHEAISLALAEQAPAVLFDGVDRELVEHLVGSHHGWGRPLFPSVNDTETLMVKVEIDGLAFEATTGGSHPGWSQPDRFRALCDRYGPWGLAWLESIVRLADIAISKEGK